MGTYVALGFTLFCFISIIQGFVFGVKFRWKDLMKTNWVDLKVYMKRDIRNSTMFSAILLLTVSITGVGSDSVFWPMALIPITFSTMGAFGVCLGYLSPPRWFRQR